MHAVLTLDDLAPVLAQRRMLRHSNSGTPLDRVWPFALADGEVSYVGETVALVVADDRYLAEDAAALVEIDYETLPAAADCRKAAQPDAPTVRRELKSNVIASYRVAFGDAEAAFGKAAHVLHEDFWQHRGAGHSIEGRGILVEFRGADDSLTVWASTQKAHDLRQSLTVLLDLEESALRVAAPDIGGGFGPKLCVYPEDVAVVAAAKLLGARSNGSRTGASISPMRCRSATSIGRSTSRSTRTARCSAFAAACCTISAPMRCRTSTCPTTRPPR